MKGIIDRIEGEFAVVEIEGTTQDFPKNIFPEEAKAGDVVEINGDKVSILKNETEALRKEVEDLMDEVWED